MVSKTSFNKRYTLRRQFGGSGLPVGQVISLRYIPTPPYSHILPALVLLRKPLFGLAKRRISVTLNDILQGRDFVNIFLSKRILCFVLSCQIVILFILLYLRVSFKLCMTRSLLNFVKNLCAYSSRCVRLDNSFYGSIISKSILHDMPDKMVFLIYSCMLENIF